MAVMSSSIVLLTFLYFIQGLPYGFQASFLPMYLRMQGVSLTNLSLFKLLLAPWFCKALWAPLVDKKATKQKWLLWSVSGLVFVCAFATLSSPTNLFVLSFIVFFLNFFAATQDIAVDGIAVALLTSDELGKGNTAQVVGYKIGSIFGGGVLVWFMDSLGWSGLFFVLTLLYIEALLFIYLSPTLRNLHLDAGGFEESEEYVQCDNECHEDSNIDVGACDLNESLLVSRRKELDKEESTDVNTEKSANNSESLDSTDSNRSDSFEIVENEQVRSTDDVSSDDKKIEVPEVKKADDPLPSGEITGEIQSHSQSDLKQRKINLSDSLEQSEEPVDLAEENAMEINEEECEYEIDEFEPIGEVSKWTSKLVGGKFEFIHEIVCVPGTLWMLVYVAMYKLGEQGAVGMMPLFLIDKKVKASDTTFWMGVVGQAVSIVGSFLGGYVITKYRFPTALFLQQLTLCRLVPMGITLWVVALWQWKMLPVPILYYTAILAAMVMLLISGMVTTVTFTFMMQCSRGAHLTIQATHYTILTTVEVFGKLAFMSLSGWLVDIFDYAPMYLVFTGLAAVIMFWFKRMPRTLDESFKLKLA